MGNLEDNKGQIVVVKISEDEQKAYIEIHPSKTEKPTVAFIKQCLGDNGVVYGIKEDVIENIVEEKQYFIEFLVAEGEESKPGRDGYFEFLFETNVDVKPKILEDGSVDYRSMGAVPVVQEGDELVHYIPAVKGRDGRTVTGKIISGKKGRELRPLLGKGFIVSEDKLVYKAAVTGKVTYTGNKLMISTVFQIQGDVTIATGDIHFSGDITIKGDVLTGAVVKAGGSISVDGYVEAAQLIAGKDIILKNGMQGGGKGIIEAGRDVSGKFFEQVTIKAKGNVAANAIMNCNVFSEEEVVVSGKHGIIVGGMVQAYRRIASTLIGNMAGVKTIIEAGCKEDLYVRLSAIEKLLREAIAQLEKYKTGLSKIDDRLSMMPTHELSQKKIQIMQLKITQEAEFMKLLNKKKDIITIMEKVSQSKISVDKTIYPGVKLCINGTELNIKKENYNVTYRKKGVEIETIPNMW